MKETNKVSFNIAAVLTHTEKPYQNKTLYLLLTDSHTITHCREKIAYISYSIRCRYYCNKQSPLRLHLQIILTATHQKKDREIINNGYNETQHAPGNNNQEFLYQVAA